MKKITVFGVVLVSFILLSLPAGAFDCSDNKVQQSQLNRIWAQVNIINQANIKLQSYKTWYQSSGLDLIDYGFSQQQINALNTYFTSQDDILTEALLTKLEAIGTSSQDECLY